MFQRVMQGPLDKPENQSLRDLSARERWVLIPLVALMFAIGIMPNPVLNLFDQSSERILGRVRVTQGQTVSARIPASHPQMSQMSADEGRAKRGR
jgi:NADH:ubiquinone oxidoreductase subunit 4 (subunit M)